MTGLYYLAGAISLIYAWYSFGLLGKWWLSKIFTYIYLILMIWMAYMFIAVEQKPTYILASFIAAFFAAWCLFVKYLIQFDLPEKRTKIQQEYLDELEKRNKRDD
ncbi:MAG: hypothetical protein CL526_01890 [Aequorivita sp.]|nr:hypothetical protein [Aequorivita sp.]|tara:strand:- start:2452 stop:2766 length:315 start_codon:yes stop_codon:yes gene_type:complete